ncbi:hypothetical protein LTR36_004485 [Oleoguttula mirabilis]|uniref:Mmc1 C-terminal domain-containing protein n=1 Tax=Oleoguttula mirabilis TaxID=1507867 RepID=A0AAV9JHG1_9PEZI|nr:hypothetical protein LTR36_004485 [Oleoguttula mirabilis]
MPSRLAAGARSLKAASIEPYVCPSCCLRAIAGHTFARTESTRFQRSARSASSGFNIQRGTADGRPRKIDNVALRVRRHQSAKRHASNGSLASVTAINAPSTVPAAYRDLHQRVLALQDSASGYVDLSRLQLAARSLESDDPVVRVALLGLGRTGALAARKLARVILSDALSDEETWEQELLQTSQDGRSLLLRYGDAEDAVQHSPLVQTIHIPSPFLKRHNLEILVTTLNADGRSAHRVTDAELEEAILVPPLTTPTSAGGRVGFVRYPVHKALVVAEGITGAVEYGRLPRFLDRAYLINAALSLPLRSSTGVNSAEQAATDNVVDIDLATHALGLFRTSRANGAQFSDEWQTSRIPALTEWIAGPKGGSSGMNLAVRKLLDSTLLNASSSIERSESEQVSAVASATVSDLKRTDLDTQISAWSSDAHRDLQMNLSTGLASRTWRRTTWWRLLWRIDDVSVSAADILRLSWLTEAEQSLAFISGRIAEAGLATLDELKEAGVNQRLVTDGIEAEMQAWEPDQRRDRAEIKAEMQTSVAPAGPGINAGDLLQTPTLLTRVQQQSGVNALFDPPWPQTIHLSRQLMLHTLVPSLHRRAQTLLLSTLSTVGGTTALGTWLFVATADMYSGGAIAALGLVWSLRRLQTLWGKERAGFAVTVREDGRRVLAEVESHLRRIVKEGGRASVGLEDAQGWREARMAVETCQEALEKIK